MLIRFFHRSCLVEIPTSLKDGVEMFVFQDDIGFTCISFLFNEPVPIQVVRRAKGFDGMVWAKGVRVG